jgi:RNA polymerase sigma factor (sigma-70 family)
MFQSDDCSDAAGDFSDLTDSLRRLHAGDISALEELIARGCQRMRSIASRMLPSFPAVRRWDQTDDVVQNAALRLCRALADVKPDSSRAFMGLVALQVRRELLDLAKKHGRFGAYAANHETNVFYHEGEAVMIVDQAAHPADPDDQLLRWTRLHEAAEGLPEEERELFHLAWYLGLTQQEAAGVLGWSLRTVKRRWETAKTLIHTAMEGEMPD